MKMIILAAALFVAGGNMWMTREHDAMVLCQEKHSDNTCYAALR